MMARPGVATIESYDNHKADGTRGGDNVWCPVRAGVAKKSYSHGGHASPKHGGKGKLYLHLPLTSSQPPVSWLCLPFVKPTGSQTSKQPKWVCFKARKRKAENGWGWKCQMENNHHRFQDHLQILWCSWSTLKTAHCDLMPYDFMLLVPNSESIEFWWLW